MRTEMLIGLVLAAGVAWPLAANAQVRDDQLLALHSRILQVQAQSLSERINGFIKETEGQVGWTTHLPWPSGSIDQRRFDAYRLLRQVQAITEFSQLDTLGKEQLKVSRLAMDVVGSGIDFSQEKKFTAIGEKKVAYGPVYFRQSGSTGPGTPYVTVSLASNRNNTGVSIVELNLGMIQEAVKSARIGDQGVAYVVDGQGRIIAHPDRAMIERDVSNLSHVQAARLAAREAPAGTAQVVQDASGREVLATYAPAGNDWLVLVELPISEVRVRAQ